MPTAHYQSFNRRTAFAVVLLSLLASAWMVIVQATSTGGKPALAHLPDLSRLPLQFEPNAGQSDPQARFVAHASGASMLFSASGVSMLLSAPPAGTQNDSNGTKANRADSSSPQLLAHMSFIGANSTVNITGDGALPGKANYMTGNDRSNWHTNLPTYSGITYSDLYRGVSLAYSASESRLKGTYTITPGADPGSDQVAI